jgi:hypothetical protein
MEDFRYVLPATKSQVRIAFATVYQDSPCSREHPHQLLEGLERLANLESYVHFVYPVEIGGKRSEMEGIIPLP